MPLTIAEAKELFGGASPATECALEVGQCYLIRTVTHYYTGRLAAVTAGEFVLDDAAWIADTGRFSDSLKDGTLNEVEPYPGRCIVFRGACVDAVAWPHPLPRTKK